MVVAITRVALIRLGGEPEISSVSALMALSPF
jgi:hypothetical protein